MAVLLRGGVGFAIGIGPSRRIGPVPVTTAVAMAGVIVSGVAVRTEGRGATVDAAEIRLPAAIETVRSGSTVGTREMRWSTRDIARRCARSTTRKRTAGAQTRRRATGAETRRGTSEAWRRTRKRAELSLRGIWRDECGAEHHAYGQHQKIYFRHVYVPSI